MARLPNVGGDTDAWGTVLNDYLTQNIPHRYTLGSASVVGASTVTVDKTPAGLLSGGTHIAVGATTTKCEIRRITGIAGNVLTLDAPGLRYAHSAGEFVWVLPSFYVPLEWFGGKVQDTATGWTAVMAASIEWGVNGGDWGIDGHDTNYYLNNTVCFPDNLFLRNIRFTAQAPWAYDLTLGFDNGGRAAQFEAALAGQFVTVLSVDTAANTITFTGNLGSTALDSVWLYATQGGSVPGGVTEGRRYWFVNTTGNTYTLSQDSGGSVLDITSAGSETIYGYSTGASRMQWDKVRFEGGNTQALNGLIAFCQQPSVARSLRIEDFPGEVGGFLLTGQQGDFYTTEIIHCYIGMRLGTDDAIDPCQFMYFFGPNVEACDIGMITDGMRDTRFFGGHWEQIGTYYQRTQSISGNGLVTAGTFTLTFGGATTGSIAYNAVAATIQTALEGLAGINPGDITVTDVGGGLPNGWVRIDFKGQYLGANMQALTLTITNSLTGGTYSINVNHPDTAVLRIQKRINSVGFHGGVYTGAKLLPDGTLSAFLNNLNVTNAAFSDYFIENLVSISGDGNVVRDDGRGITIPWGPSVTNDQGVDEHAGFIAAFGRHQASGGYPFQLRSGGTGWVGFQNQLGSLEVLDGAALKVGDNGTAYKAHAAGATASVADGGTVSHGLGVAPDVVVATGSVAGEFLSVTAKSSTTFTVAIKKNDGTAGTTQTVYWQAYDLV